jgi:serine/threonine-protein kinase
VTPEPPPPEADPLVGRVVAGGRYQIVSVLGQGGMGTVYRALQKPLDRMVVLKLIHPELTRDAGAVGRFQREMKVTVAIEHPNTVRVYDFGEIDGQPFLAMEHLDGRSVRAVLDAEGAFAPARLASVGIGVANALGAAHAAGIVHRDLKPENVMLVDAYGQPDFVKVLDFGIARPPEGEVGFKTATGVLLGTPAYMSPEQCSGAAVDGRSDLYALGVMLYEMATGRPPFVGNSFTALLIAHTSAAPPPLAGRARDLPVPIEQLITRLLAKSPDDRPATAEEIVRVLAPFARAGGGRAAGEGTAAPMGQGARSTGGETVVAVGTVGGTVIAPSGTTVRDRAAPRPPTAQTQVLPEIETGKAGAAGAGRSRGRWAFGALAAGVVVAGALVLLHPWSRPQTGTGLGAGDGDATDVARLLAAEGEPPWPDVCRPGAPVLPRLAEAARALRPGAPPPGRPEALATLRALPEDLAARWLIEARAPTGDGAAAAVAAQRAAALCPASAVAQHLHGNALQKAQQLPAAEAAYRRAIALAPDYAAPRFNLALVALRGGDADGALAALEPLVTARPDLPNLFLVRAEAHRKRGDLAAAMADLDQQTRRHPDGADGWYQLGRARAAQKVASADDAFCRAKALGHTGAAALCPQPR